MSLELKQICSFRKSMSNRNSTKNSMDTIGEKNSLFIVLQTVDHCGRFIIYVLYTIAYELAARKTRFTNFKLF